MCLKEKTARNSSKERHVPPQSTSNGTSVQSHLTLKTMLQTCVLISECVFPPCLLRPIPAVPPETDAPGAAPAPPAGQALQRSFSLLSSPSEGCTLPLHHMVSLVSMTSPRSSRPHRLSSSPAFVEFDMTESGYGWVRCAPRLTPCSHHLRPSTDLIEFPRGARAMHCGSVRSVGSVA